jgi:hypothetical protein
MDESGDRPGPSLSSRAVARGLSVLDVVVAVALLALLVYLLRMDWQRMPSPPGGSPPPSALAAP